MPYNCILSVTNVIEGIQFNYVSVCFNIAIKKVACVYIMSTMFMQYLCEIFCKLLKYLSAINCYTVRHLSAILF